MIQGSARKGASEWASEGSGGRVSARVGLATMTVRQSKQAFLALRAYHSLALCSRLQGPGALELQTS
eukprot:174916-Alexandrium_andersonii.AAC.1